MLPDEQIREIARDAGRSFLRGYFRTLAIAYGVLAVVGTVVAVLVWLT